ncbi:MAG: hypothetical protein ACK4YV_03220 [Emticicia sp.]
MAKERDLDKLFKDYDNFMASIGLGLQKDNKPKASVFGNSKEELSNLAKELDKGLYKRENFMQGFRKPLIAMFAANAALMLENNFSEEDFVNLKTNYAKTTKVEYCNLVAKVFKNKSIYEHFLSNLDQDVRKVWEFLVWKDEVSDEEILNETGISITIRTEKSSYNNKKYIEKDLRKDFMALAIDTDSNYSYNSNSYLKTFTAELPIELRRVAKNFYDKPLHYNFIPLKEAPKTTYISSSENEIFVNLPNLLSYNQQGNIKVSGPGKVMLNTLGKIRKTLNINEFYPDTSSKDLQQLKTYLLSSMVVCENKAKKEETFTGILKNYFEKTYTKKYASHVHILTSLKGSHNLYNVNDIETNFIEVTKHLPINEWVSIKNFVDFASFRSYNFQISTIHEMCNYLTYEVEEKYGKEKKSIKKSNLKTFIEEPILKGNIMLWSCYGLIDIAYDDIDTTELGKTYFSVYDGIKALKLTNLGAYILEKVNQYEAPKVKKSYELSLSTENLIILVDGETSMTDNLLATYADKIGSNRYAVSNESFLKSINSKKELKIKIDIFKQVIGTDLPTNWKTFFSILDKKIHPLTPIEEVLVFKIPSDDPELIKLLIQNPTIKKLLIKAEDYQIIVTRKDYPTLKTKLKAFGYLLN